MTRSTAATRSLIGLLIVLVVAALVALPALANHEPGHSPPGQSGKPGKPDKAKVPGIAVTITGEVRASTDAEGETTYTLEADGRTYELDAGPSWFHGDNHPLKGMVGKSVTIAGSHKEGSLEVDVETVDGQALREPGKPPWAGGWKQVGEGHPGWSQEKQDRMNAKFGDCFPPGQCKEKPARASGEPEGD
jgi:hypothetical protein